MPPTRFEALLILWKGNRLKSEKEYDELVSLLNANVQRLEREKELAYRRIQLLSEQGRPPTPSDPEELPPADPAALQAIRLDREAIYGETGLNMRTIGMVFSAHVEAHYRLRLPHPIPPHVASNMLVGMKTVRACGPSYHRDNYDDAHNFLTFAQEFDYRRTNANTDDRLLYGNWGDDKKDVS